MTAIRVGSVPSDIYQAYAGPDTGGFSLLPPSAVPRLDASPNLPSELGLQSIDEPLPFAASKTAPSKGAIKVGVLPDLASQSAMIEGPGASYAKHVKPHDVVVKEARDLFSELTTPGINADRTAAGNIAQSAMTNYANAALATPSLAADVLSYPLRRAGLVPGGAGLDASRHTDVFGAVPKLTVEDIGAGMASLRGDQTFEEAKRRGAITEAERKAQYPIATGIGEVGGDVAAIATGRAPFQPGLRAGEVAVEKAIKKGVPVSAMEPFLSRPDFLKAMSKSPGFNTLKKVLGRTTEAGIEGAGLALVKGEDPVESAGFTAGAQFALGGTSQALLFKYLKIPRFGRAANFAVNMAILSPIFYAADVALPGEAKDYEAQRSAAQKLLWGYALGGTLGLVSNRARSGMFSVNTPNLTDALASAPRNAMQSVIVDYLSSDETKRMDLKGKITKMYSNLDQLSDTQLRDLSAAFGAGKERFYSELDKVLKGLPSQ